MRRHQIHQIFRRDGFTNCTKLAGELEVGVRTVLRDIETMRRMDLPIDYDARRRAYFYAEPVYHLPGVPITASDLLALRVASTALAQNEGTPFHRRLMRIYRALLGGLGREDGDFSPGKIETAFSFYHVGVGVIDADVFESLTKAVLRGHEVEFDHRRPGESATRRHRVRPYFISNRENLFYLLARESGIRGIKSFAIPRIVGRVRFTGKAFVRPKRFSPAKYFRNAFRIFPGEAVHAVTLRINSRAAPYIKERRWHQSEKLTECADGSLMLQMELSDTRDLRSWILRWGPDIEVLEPAELRRAVAQVAKEMAAIYN